MACKKYVLTGTTDSETTEVIRGTITAIRIDVTGTTPATADITVAEAGTLGRTLASGTDLGADAIRYPAFQQTAADGTGTGTYAPAHVCDKLTITLAQGDADNVVNVYIVWIPDRLSG